MSYCRYDDRSIEGVSWDSTAVWKCVGSLCPVWQQLSWSGTKHEFIIKWCDIAHRAKLTHQLAIWYQWHFWWESLRIITMMLQLWYCDNIDTERCFVFLVLLKSTHYEMLQQACARPASRHWVSLDVDTWVLFCNIEGWGLLDGSSYTPDWFITLSHRPHF